MRPSKVARRARKKAIARLVRQIAVEERAPSKREPFQSPTGGATLWTIRRLETSLKRHDARFKWTIQTRFAKRTDARIAKRVGRAFATRKPRKARAARPRVAKPRKAKATPTLRRRVWVPDPGGWTGRWVVLEPGIAPVVRRKTDHASIARKALGQA